jgi:hypothetical protein
MNDCTTTIEHDGKKHRKLFMAGKMEWGDWENSVSPKKRREWY